MHRFAGPLFILAGTLHFTHTRFYEAMVSPWLPRPREVVYASGMAEIAGGMGLLAERTRRPAGWWLLATLVAVFPANVYMALNPERYSSVPPAALWARLPFQLVFAAIVRRAMR